ncbi:MAG: hypothetical protein A2025_03095, partial [Chloroflexi bacterium RBG_19FT_COMBO_47_15]
MKTHINLLLVLIVSTLLIFTTIVSCTVNEPSPTSATDGDIETLLDVLDKAGFYVQEGEYSYTDAIALCNAGVIKTCQGNNVGAPYLAYKLPPAPEQTTPNMFADSRGWAYSYRLRPDEAILQIGRTPPESRYFAYQSYLSFRYNATTKHYIQMFDSLGDTVNPLTINTKGKEDNPFDQPVIFITTADKGIDTRVRTAVENAGYPSGIINTDVIPSSVVNMGLENDDDLFQFLSRVALPKDKDSLDAYINNPGSTVLRLTPKTPPKLDPFPTPELRVRGTGNTEMDLLPAVDDLRAAILAKYSHLEATDIPTYMFVPEGYTAIQSNLNLLGDCRDTAYFSTLKTEVWSSSEDLRMNAAFTLGDNPDEFVIIFGVNHEATGKTTYSSCTVYGMR